MKNIYKLGVLMLVLAPQFALASFDINLRYGNSNDGVREMQEFLADQGVYAGPITGNFYSLTLRAVKKFQSEQSIIPASGFWGPMTRRVAQSILDQQLQKSNLEASVATPVVALQNPPTQSAQQAVSQSTTPIIPSVAQTPQPEPQSTIPQVSTPSSQARIEVFSPVPAKGIGRRLDPATGADVGYRALPLGCGLASNSVHNEANCQYDESNYVLLGAVVYNEDGMNSKTAVVKVTATDSEQNKVIDGTGNIAGSSQKFAGNYYYDFTYFFRSSGTHTITFSANGVASSVNLVVN